MTHISPNILGIGTLVLATTLAVAGAVWGVAEEIEEVRREVGDQLAVIDGRLDDIGQQQIGLNERQAAMAQNIERVARDVESLEQNVERVEQKVESLEQNIERVEQKVERVEQKVERIEHRLDDLPQLIAQELGAATGQ